MTRFVLASCLTMALLLAGCSSGGSSGDSAADDSDTRNRAMGNTTTPPGPTPGTSPGATPTTPDGTNQTDNVTYEWRTTYANGTIDPGAAPLLEPPEPAEESVMVEAGTADLWLNVSAPEAPMIVQVRPPSCTEDACAETEELAAGSTAELNFPAPETGSWTIRMTWDGSEMVLGSESAYVIEAAQKVAAAAPGNSTAY